MAPHDCIDARPLCPKPIEIAATAEAAKISIIGRCSVTASLVSLPPAPHSRRAFERLASCWRTQRKEAAMIQFPSRKFPRRPWRRLRLVRPSIHHEKLQLGLGMKEEEKEKWRRNQECENEPEEKKSPPNLHALNEGHRRNNRRQKKICYSC